MRGQTTVHLPCLTDLAKKNEGGAAETFWFHGGEGRFDNQVDFWSAHGVDHILSLKDFPEDMARTGWGVGDASLFSEVGSRLEQMKTQSRAPFLLGMILTVSNHIPWTVPADLPTFHPPEGLSHPSYATTAYADAAFGRFIDDLKRRDLWNDTLLIVASDHGNNVEPYADLYGDSPVRTQFLQSHINLLMTGGLVAQSLTNEGKQQLTIETPVSQADIAALVAYVSGLTGGRFMGENPLRQSRELPVLATLEQEVFDPLAAQSYPRRVAASTPDVEANPQNAKTLLYFRAFLQYTYSWGATRP
jgi:phosphoglycerol transferase MdoB-like AlkP superfamily enzyme